MPKPPPEHPALDELTQYQSNDPALLLDYAIGLVRGYCGWHITPEVSETLIVDGSGTHDLLLPTMYLTDVSWVTDDGATVQLDDVQWWSYGRLVRSCDRWTCKPHAVEVDVTHGYAEVPADLRAVIASVADRAITMPTGVRAESAGALSITYADDYASSGAIGTDARRVLDRYRIWNRP